MAVNMEKENTVLRLWLLFRHVGDTLALCQDSVYGKYGLTSEQFGVLGSIKAQGPLRINELARILRRFPNSMSMLVDRMVKAGLVKRARNRKDRRMVTVQLTSKGEDLVKPALLAGWEFIHQILLAIPYDDQCTLASTLETVKCELTGYLHPDIDKAEILRNSFTNNPNLYEHLLKNLLPAGYEVKRTAGKRT